jgi:hypothetical protein
VYPIEDELLKVMPKIHNSEDIGQKPKASRIKVEKEIFERLLGIWEFYNTFSEFLKLPKFKIEELYAAINWDAKSKPSED